MQARAGGTEDDDDDDDDDDDHDTEDEVLTDTNEDEIIDLNPKPSSKRKSDDSSDGRASPTKKTKTEVLGFNDFLNSVFNEWSASSAQPACVLI